MLAKRLGNGTKSYICFTLSTDVKISFSSTAYSDINGASGKNAIFYKQNNGNYNEVYYKMQQQNNTIKYGEYYFSAGNYRLEPEENYVTFDEWDFEIVN